MHTFTTYNQFNSAAGQLNHKLLNTCDLISGLQGFNPFLAEFWKKHSAIYGGSYFKELALLKNTAVTTSKQLYNNHQSQDLKQQVGSQDGIYKNGTSQHEVGIAKNSKKIFKQTPSPTADDMSIKTLADKSSKRRRRDLWKPEEDAIVLHYVATIGHKWSQIALQLSNRTGKQVRDRFLNSLQSDLRSDQWTPEEDDQLIMLYCEHGKKWCKIASHMPGRSEMLVKNRFYAHLRHRAGKCKNEKKLRNEVKESVKEPHSRSHKASQEDGSTSGGEDSQYPPDSISKDKLSFASSPEASTSGPYDQTQYRDFILQENGFLYPQQQLPVDDVDRFFSFDGETISYNSYDSAVDNGILMF